MKRRTVLATVAATLLALALAGCSAPATTPQPAEAELLAEYGLTDMSAASIIDHLDRMPVRDRPAELIASVRQDALVLTDDVGEVTIDMPDDVTYLSIAPYVSRTHECFSHSLTTCRGELSEQVIQIRIVDHASGDVIVDESRTTFDNGFAGFWIPRDLQGTIEVTYDGRSGTTSFSTAIDAATCITTLQLT